MKFVLSPDSFKECMTASRASAIMMKAITDIIRDAEIIELPVGDGGEGTMEILASVSNGVINEATVTGPLGEPVRAKYAILGDGKTAVVEMAQASGLQLVPTAQRNPLHTTSFGTGELILKALEHQIDTLIVSIGGSATNDCGAGMLQALGAKLLAADGQPISFGGEQLNRISQIDLSTLDPRLKKVSIKAACDVTNPLVGLDGASLIFGPQKGATAEMAVELDASLTHFADLVLEQYNIRLHDVKGAGAAGGLGAALLLCGGALSSGIELVLDALSFNEKIANADYVITGEGRIDRQTPGGKVIAGIVRRSKQAGIPVLAFGGSVQSGYEALYEEGLLAVFSLTAGPCTLDEALKQGESNLYNAVTNVMRMLQPKG